jgi:quercetin dioxygenase-like cupin family protein
MNFEPEDLTYQEGLERIRAADQRSAAGRQERILTSRDPGMEAMRESLRVGRMPEGFAMWQLPVTLKNVLLFMSVASPGARMPLHRHAHPVFRVILSGSITYEGKELTAGDWMFIPAGREYSFETGPMGAVFFYPHGEQE